MKKTYNTPGPPSGQFRRSAIYPIGARAVSRRRVNRLFKLCIVTARFIMFNFDKGIISPPFSHCRRHWSRK